MNSNDNQALSKSKPHFLILFLVLWICVEVIFMLAPFVVPNHWYLKAYLTETAEQKTEQFIQQGSATLPDRDLGWRNRPGFSADTWVIDKWGGRHHKEFDLEKPANTHRSIILGSSLVNGSNIVDNNGTISAFMDQQFELLQNLKKVRYTKSFETMNFATMMYSLDQIYIQIQEQIIHFKPDTLIIGLHEDPSAPLESVYVPFRLPDEENMPYIKPWLSLENAELVHHKAPVEFLPTLDDEALQYFEINDSYHYNFERFKHFGFMPISNQLSSLYLKAMNFLYYWSENENQFTLTRAIMSNIQTFADKNNIEVIYLYLPTARSFNRSGIWQYIPDYYDARYQWLSRPWNENEPTAPTVVDIRDYFKYSGYSAEQLYAGDYFHFSKLGNEVIASKVVDLMVDKN